MRLLGLLSLCICAVVSPPPGQKKCVNGTLANGICLCDFGYTGTMCHRKMNCDTLERLPNGSCEPCVKGWAGADCDRIDCGENGAPNGDHTRCRCEDPYSGEYCDVLKTGDVLHSYNRYFTTIGPLGVIFVIPLALMVRACNKASAKLRTAKVERHLETHIVKGMDLDPKVIHKLLKK
ncbi:unnamed protein product, partial [Mesorhabditis belari]|uniref:EGF-like domain-containing protein n=1 Tax=Mesorhabditis belari TaxID=2138241 RepID=A0AAF3E8D9_9BILA